MNVYQTKDASSSSRLKGGFSSETSTSGSFSASFPTTGVFYFATELSTQAQLVLRGAVNVTTRTSSSAGLEVAVSGYPAEYVPAQDSSGGNTTLSGGNKMRRQTSSCMEDAVEDVNTNIFSLTYSVCSTPYISSVTPQNGTILTRFNISGERLISPLGEAAVVQFSGHSCQVLFSSDTLVTCIFDASTMPPSFTNLSLSVTIPGLGNADISVDTTSITLVPVITAISPAGGSTQGGTYVFIRGSSFPESGLSVQLGDEACRIVSQTYSSLMCVSAPQSDRRVEVVVWVTSNPPTAAVCAVDGGCYFNYTSALTPIISEIAPTSLIGPSSITLNITGQLFAETAEDNVVTVGNKSCAVFFVNASFLRCMLEPVPHGNYSLYLSVCPPSPNESSMCLGRALVSFPSPLVSPAELTTVSPSDGSVAGGTLLTLSGRGFSSEISKVSVSIGGSVCTVLTSSYSTVTCTTSPGAEGRYNMIVTSGGGRFPTQVYTYSMAATPLVSSIFPTSGQAGLMVTLSGSNLQGSLSSSTSVQIGGAECCVNQTESNSSSIMCELSNNLAGAHSIALSVDGLGTGMSDTTFNYDLQLSSFSPTTGSFAGMSALLVEGLGFNPTSVTISVCNEPCDLTTSAGSLSELQCLLPTMSSTESQLGCPVQVESQGVMQAFSNMFMYDAALTPVMRNINRTRGGTQGGSRILISGEGFTGTVNVSIAGVECTVLQFNSTNIVCETGASGRTIRAQVMVFVEGMGFARSENIVFWYVDLWSSRFTWGGQDPPKEGDFVVVPQGQTLVVDTVTPILAYLLVQGGELVFDNEAADNQVALHTQGMLITGGGRLEVGTEQAPFLSRTQIVLYGDVLSTEIPLYGAKTLALREGSIDIHGKPLQVTWTRLQMTAAAGSTQLTLQEPVDWEVGGKIVVSSTSFSQRENEELNITAIDESGMVLTVDPPLRYEHIAATQTIEGRTVVTAAEVGYLTRNVIVRGNVNSEWVSEVSACEREFRPGQFDVQTCFLGRFGEETLSDQFGSQIMIHAAEQNKGLVAGRFSYVEVTHAGQAFRLGRYPIHFHLNGNVSGSYVRGCSIHHTFNRAVTIHAVDYLLVEKNVAYNILGHAYFLEDGIEENNIIQDNLGIFVRASSSLLNVDITPATFWIVNPNNIVRRNVAAGGSHFGFWYRLPPNPTGPSFTSSVCPRHIPLGEFSGNSAHSFGWYGLWVFPAYSPREGGSCSSTSPQTPAIFSDFLAWKNDRGVEVDRCGAFQLHDSILLDNRLAGVEVISLEASWGGPLINNTIVVGHSAASASDSSLCTEAGIKTPHTPYLTVTSVTFVNFDRPNCFPISACSQCKRLQGGFETRYSDISFTNSDPSRLTSWNWMHEHAHRDMDGSLTGTGQHSVLVPSAPILPPSCTPHVPSSHQVAGSICPGSVELARLGLFSVAPSSLKTEDLNIFNSYGSVTVEYEDKRLLIGDGHMALLPVNMTYGFRWQNGIIFTNTSYRLRISSLVSDSYVIFQQPYPRPLDYISIDGKVVKANESSFSEPPQATTGDWYSDENNTINYIITGEERDTVDLSLLTYACFYENCIPPPPPTLPPPIPPGRPEQTLSWSNVSIWPGGELPKEGDDIFINCTWYLLLDTTIPRLGMLTICGSLELLDGMDHIVQVDLIIIQGGRLVTGYPDTPFTSRATFLLHGNKSSPEHFFTIGPILGAKALGAFGELILTGTPRSPSWTTLAATVAAGGTQISLSDPVEWEVGDEIVITSTSFEGKQSEKAVISTVSGSRTTLTLRDPVQYQHIYETETVGSLSYTVAAEVGLLTRNIVIGNGENELADSEAFGCRVLVGNIQVGEKSFVGSIQMEGVELRGCGQRGYTEIYDPRYALAVLNANGRGSYIRSCSIHDGYNTGIGIFGTNAVELTDNVIHNTVGSSIHGTGSHLVVTGNLASLNHFLATYRATPTTQPANPEWTANYELTSTFNLTLQGNVAAGGGKAGFHINGDACSSSGVSVQVKDNRAHSTLHCWHQGYDDGHPSGCTLISQFTAHSCYHYAIFSYCPAEVRVRDSTLVNNYAAIYVSVIGPPSLSHMRGEKMVVVESSLIVSASPSLGCTGDSLVPEIALHPLSHSGLRSPVGGHAGIIIPTFVSGKGHFTLSGWSSISTYPAITGLTIVRNITFANFGARCEGKRDVLLVTHRQSEDCNHPTHLQGTKRVSISDNALTYFNHNPLRGSINPADCVDMDCDGLKHVLVQDQDGSLTGLGTPMSLLSRAEIGWVAAGEEGDTSRGIGDFRIPSVMLAVPGGGMNDANTLFPKKGIVRGTESFGNGSQCVWKADWNSYLCRDINHLMIVIESLDGDTEVSSTHTQSIKSLSFQLLTLFSHTGSPAFSYRPCSQWLHRPAERSTRPRLVWRVHLSRENIDILWFSGSRTQLHNGPHQHQPTEHSTPPAQCCRQSSDRPGNILHQPSAVGRLCQWPICCP